MYDVMVDRGTDPSAMEIFVWIKEQGLHFNEDWFWHTVPGSSFMKVSFAKEEYANWFKLRWL